MMDAPADGRSPRVPDASSSHRGHLNASIGTVLHEEIGSQLTERPGGGQASGHCSHQASRRRPRGCRDTGADAMEAPRHGEPVWTTSRGSSSTVRAAK